MSVSDFGKRFSKGRATLYLAGGTPVSLYLQQVMEMRAERMDIMHTFGNERALFFGQKANLFRYSAIVMDFEGHRDRENLIAEYNEKLRASASASTTYDTYVTIQFNKSIRHGYLVDLLVTSSADRPDLATIQFTMWVPHHWDINTSGAEGGGASTSESNPTLRRAVSP